MKDKRFKFVVLLVLALMLFARCADAANTKPLDDKTFLNLCANGTAREVENAIKAGANIKAVGNEISFRGDRGFSSSYNWTTLMVAAVFNSDLEVITVLVKNGADVNAKNTTAPAEWINPDGHTALMRVASEWRRQEESNNSAIEVITALVKNGADVNARTSDGWTALMYAYGYDVITALIEKGADVNARNANDETPLMWAGLNSGAESVKALIRAGADVNARDRFGKTVLIRAAERESQQEEIAVLIKNGADINARDVNGYTALMHAVMNFRPSRGNPNPEATIITLLKNGADAKLKDDNGKMAIDYAKDNENIANTDVFWKLNDASY